MSTKVGKTGKYGVRGGVGIRKKYLLAIEDKQRKFVQMWTKDKLKRVATGIYQCQKCKAKVSGGAYKFKTTTK